MTRRPRRRERDDYEDFMVFRVPSSRRRPGAGDRKARAALRRVSSLARFDFFVALGARGPRLRAELAVGTDPDEFQDLVVRLAVDEDQVRPDPAFPFASPLARSR